jgi:hypothetical protein
MEAAVHNCLALEIPNLEETITVFVRFAVYFPPGLTGINDAGSP